MATKLKSYKIKITVKAIAFILMVVLFFTGAVNTISPLMRLTSDEISVLDVYENMFEKDWEKQTVQFFKSSLVKNQLQQDGVYLYLYGKYFHNEENVKNGTVQKQLESEFKQYYDNQAEEQIASELDNSKNKIRNEIAMQYGVQGSTYYGMYSDSTKIPPEIVDEYLKEHPELLPNEQEIRERQQRSYENTVRAMRGNFSKVYTTVTERISKMQPTPDMFSISAITYVLILPDGTRLTNDEKYITTSIDELQTEVYNSVVGYSYSKEFGRNSTKHNTDSVLIQHGKIAERGRFNYEKPLDDLQLNELLSHLPADNDELYTWLKKDGIDLYMFFSGFLCSGDVYGNLKATYDINLTNLKTGTLLLAAAVIILIVLLFTAGTRDENGKIVKAPIDRVWNDVHLAVTAVIIGYALLYLWMLTLESPYNNIFCDVPKIYRNYYIYDLEFWALLTIIWTAATEWLMSVIRHVKARTFWKHTSIGAIIRKVKSCPKKHRIRNKIRALREKLRSRPYKLHELRKDIWVFLGLYVLINAVICTIAVLFAIDYDGVMALITCVLAALFNIAVGIFLWKSIIALDKIMLAVDKAEQGSLNVNIDINSMPRWIRKFAQDVQDVQNGMRTAVQEAIKGERMKTELITNVSHDLKTPLTSIVSYVDLLKKRPIDDSEAQEYIGILDEKSAKLKRLIEDLVEASKTTTGNVTLHPVNINLYEMALQTVGENEDVLNAHGLELRLNNQPAELPVVFADNQKTWRVIENLMSNVRKYALPGTRVYISAEAQGDFGVFSIKNITKEPLEVSPEELTQRFVRGDASRSTEGSGLGLSIASNLCDLQGGKLEIKIDGDLFKATVYLPLVK